MSSFGTSLAGVDVDLHIFDAVAGLPVELVERYLFALGGSKIEATGRVTSDRRKKPFQLARGAMYAVLRFRGRLGFKTNKYSWFRLVCRAKSANFSPIRLDSCVLVMF